jgi:hypothetical protein
LGNNHVIYPSFNRATYQHLIEATCRRYTDEIRGTSKLDFVVSCDLLDEIYRNAVFPAQGTRPLFSSIHALLSAPLVNFTLWALEHGARAGTKVSLTVDDSRQHLVARFGDQVSLRPVCFELNRLRQRNQADFKALLSVHEAGHGLIYALLFLQAPQEIKINAATFAGGYNRYLSQKTQSARNVLDSICVVLGGRAAETMVFGDESCSNGSENDLTSATAMAAQYIRHWGFGSRLSRSDVAKSRDENINTDILSSNDVIEEILQRQFARAKQLLKEHADVFRRMTRALANDGEIAKETLSPVARLAQWGGLSSRCRPSHHWRTICKKTSGVRFRLCWKCYSVATGSLEQPIEASPLLRNAMTWLIAASGEVETRKLSHHDH